MKKTILSLAFVAALMTSCNKKEETATEATAETVDTAATAVDTAATTVDTAATTVDTAAAKATEEVKK
ncbi:hypothetical protein NAT51_04640 [Flavobacterium amniphilum]|uniref:hypothetical protein n=1 Tax=Flavobacterium amniphilum TaxID=1834035 RepID=UPI002029E5A9|nr:hypothetical protein [Flavobacterium amniphilum]MCL9804795.1 hypothetical protein [Flavobacterium amniphilum]